MSGDRPAGAGGVRRPTAGVGRVAGRGGSSGRGGDATLPVAGVALITPWDRLTDLAQTLYWYLPVRWRLCDRYDSIAYLREYGGKVKTPVAERDEIIPARHSQDLYDALREPKQRWIFADAGHNRWPVDPRDPWWDTVLQWLNSPARRVTPFPGQGVEVTGRRLGDVCDVLNWSDRDPTRQHGLEFGVGLAQHFLGGFPVYTGVSNRHAVFKLAAVGGNGLVTPGQVALDHETDDGTVASEFDVRSRSAPAVAAPDPCGRWHDCNPPRC